MNHCCRRTAYFQQTHPWLCALLLAISLFCAQTGFAQASRKLKSGAQPEYPELARQNHIRGIARVQLLVSPEGKVVEIKELGGNPVLLQALTQAVKDWKYERADSESTLVVKVNFNP